VKILVQRDIFTDKSTTSKVYVDDQFFCYGLEDVDRKLECNPECKVDGQTAIPRGTYKVIIDFSTRFQCLMPRVVDVPGFQGIRIHPGNSSADTHGCLLVGTTRKDDFVGNSKTAYAKLLDMIENALDRGQDVEIEYK
jgi:hypothetical protein